jgi:GAF domain-containing protein
MGTEAAGTFGRFDLRDLGVFDAASDGDFNTAVALAARTLGAPIAVLSILDFEAQVSRIRAHVGLDVGMPVIREVPFEAAIAVTATSVREVIAIPDCSRDVRTMAHPFMRSQGIKSLLAAPVLCPAEEVVALLAVNDRVPRIWTAEEQEALSGLAHFCTQSILLRAALRTIGLVSRGRDGGVPRR